MQQTPERVQVELSVKKLEELIQGGHLCASQVQCLNAKSKQTLWKMCLKLCGEKLCQAQCSVAKNKHDGERLI